MEYPISKLAAALKITHITYPQYSISYLLTDSREMFEPNSSLFFAIKTANDDGHNYVEELYNLGVRNFVIQETRDEWAKFTDTNFLLVKNSLAALQKVSLFHRKQFNIPIIAIAGSNGKTITKEWIANILSPLYNVTRSPRSYNSQIGVPLSLWQLSSKTQIGVFEAGISKPNEMSKLQKIIQPTIGIFTNIGDAHQDNFKNLKQKCLEKLELFVNCDVIICEEDNDLLEECMEEVCLTPKRFTWSKHSRSESHLLLEKVERESNYSVIYYSILNFNFSVKLPFIDDASIENVTNAIAVALYLNVPIDVIQQRVSLLEPIAMRLDVRRGKNNNIIVNDAYNADINSLRVALSFLGQQATDSFRRRTLILSDILESGFSDESLYQSIADLVHAAKIEKVIGIGTHIFHQKHLFDNIPNMFFETTQDFLDSRVWENLTNETILLKGSRSFEFEKIGELIEQTSHETVLDVNLDAIIHNYKFYKSRLKPQTKIVCMVKANAYGSGSIEVAKTLQYHKCDYFAVAIAEEGVELRKAGIKIPIIVLNPEVNGFNEMFANNLEPEIYNFRILEAFILGANKRGLTKYPVHIKLDTGMHRLGFTEEMLPQLINRLNQQEELRIQSVFSHLSASESWSFDDFTITQIDLFKRMFETIQSNLKYPILKHILNSAGIERFPDEQMDMVRLGISMYGISASGLEGLQNVYTLKTTILQLKELKAGAAIGYGLKERADHDVKIATIRIGYADGMNRRFGNRVGHVLVNNVKAPIVGNVCMDLTMIDVTNIDVKEGDEVIIFNDVIEVKDLANQIGTIPYEILTSISPRVKRIYYRE